MKRLHCLAVLVLFVSAGAGCAHAAVEDPALPTTSLQLMSGEPFDLAATVEGHQATVLVWWATECPCVRRYEARIEALNSKYTDDTVAVVAVASNADDGPTRVRRIATERGLTVPVVLDRSGGLATALNVRTTPSVVVFDQAGQVRFRGWIDNEREPGQAGRIAYVEDAIAAVLGGRTDAADTSPVYGCRITRTLSSPAPDAEPTEDCGCKVQ